MANEQNLIPPSERSPKELREMARKGGKKSGEVRRKRKAMREQAELLLSLPLQDGEIKDKLKEMGVDADNIDNQMAMLISIYQTACAGDTGSVSAFNSLRELVGEKKEVVEIHSADETIKELDAIIASKKANK